MWIGETTPCTGVPTLTLNGTASAGAYFAASLGVNKPPSTAAPGAAGTQAHLAVKGVSVVVATASQPLMTSPPTVNFTTPGAVAVPVIVAGSRPKTPLPPEMVSLVASAACAGAAPTITPSASARVPTTRPEMDFFIVYLLC
ncbi:unannotated protein [freshwater metagenome]|uniref:Unannotated protein n=1 Tax=freshwater metagenome TaxID=449393 RepID=A0A6J6QKG1_9ZZZZ